MIFETLDGVTVRIHNAHLCVAVNERFNHAEVWSAGDGYEPIKVSISMARKILLQLDKDTGEKWLFEE